MQRLRPDLALGGRQQRSALAHIGRQLAAPEPDRRVAPRGRGGGAAAREARLPAFVRSDPQQ